MRSRHDRLLDMAERRISLGVELGVIHRYLEDDELDGATITLDGRSLVDFSTCSYLGLNRDPRLKAGAIDALMRYGTSYSSSPTYTALPLYDTLEDQLRQMTGGAVAIAQTTTLAHLAALPSLLGPDDLALVDAQSHDSVHLATANLRGNGVTVESVPHRDMVFLAHRLAEVAGNFNKVWYLADGIYSMYGDTAPVEDVAALQAIYPNLYVYYDDAHGFGWAGEHGRGHVLARVPLNDRMVIAAGFAKAFGSLGAVLIFGDEEMARRVRLVGGPLTFSGPIPPPDLGSAVASAGIHLSAEHEELQARLSSDIEFMRSELVRLGLPVVSMEATPIWFVRVGSPAQSAEMIRRLMEDGFYLSIAAYPAVPVGRGGVRFNQSLHHSREQLTDLVQALSHHLPEVSAEPHIVIDLRDEALALLEEGDSDGAPTGAAHRRSLPAHRP
ncbi:MAG: aminotransferase class I/II-fold pyridoxal phosphate-dependent enzyme [Acidobacteria bacterium]|nr:aminotransferase class I/II-fold pyridoxal phosphate-dependent enzyme [Acidobacteriota bacterium]